MLARNAESLYWIGRYVERADDTARILDVSVHQLLEDATVDTDRAARTLLGVLGCEPPGRPARRVGGHRARRLLRRAAGLHRLVRLAGAGERPRRPRGRLRRDVGVPQRHVERPARAPAVRPVGGPARVLLLRRGPGGDVLRARGVDHEPRRHVAVLPARPLRRAGRHGRPAAAVAGVGPDVVPGVAHGAALGRRPGHLPAHLPRRARRGPGRPVPAHGQALPPLGVPRVCGRPRPA